MKTNDGFIPISDKEDIFFANTAIKENSDKSELLQLFLRKDAFDDAKFPELSKAVKYFKETEGGRSEVCKTVENYAMDYALDYAKTYAKKERIDAIQNMLELGLSKEQILTKYSEEEIKMAEKDMLAQV